MEKPQKIIIVNLLYLGDLLFAFPFLRNLRKNLPSTQIDMVVNSAFYEIVKNNPHLDRVYSFDKRWGLKKMREFSRPLGETNYDLGLNIHGSWRSLVLLWLIGPAKKIGFAERGGKILLDKLVFPSRQHMVDVYLEFLKVLNLPVLDNGRLELFIPDQAREEVIGLLNNWGVKKEDILLGLNPGGTWPTKRWSTEGFAHLADLLIGRGFKVVFTGGTEDTKRVEEIIGQMKKKGALAAAGHTSLAGLAALLERCSVVISGDSGPVHVAAAMGTPTIAIFGPSDEEKYKPRGPGHEIVKAEVDCRPCGKHECTDHKCMQEIHPETILQRVEQLLSKDNLEEIEGNSGGI